MRWLTSLVLAVPVAVLVAHCGGTVDGNVPPGGKIPKDHRTVGSTCPAERPPSMPRGDGGTLDGGDVDGGDAGEADSGVVEPPGLCKFDDECTDGKNGRCGMWYGGYGRGGGAPYPGPTCSYDQCFSDSDCSGGPCVCSSSGNRCLQGNCKTDSDCGAGGYCSPSMLSPNTGGFYCGGDAQQGWYCHTSKDECVNDSDCGAVDAGPWSGPAQCGYVTAEKKWKCVSVPLCAG
jgi:hypothetical protein